MADGTVSLRPHRLLTCTACRHCNAPCAPGLAFLHSLGVAMAAARLADISGTASLRCGARICPVVWRATAHGARLWGDVSPEVPIAALIGSGNGACAAAAAEIVTGVAVLQ